MSRHIVNCTIGEFESALTVRQDEDGRILLHLREELNELARSLTHAAAAVGDANLPP